MQRTEITQTKVTQPEAKQPELIINSLITTAETKQQPSKTRSGRVYKLICSTDPTKIYVGSTMSRLSSRLCSHRIMSQKIRKTKGSLLYNLMRSVGTNNFTIELLELTSFTDPVELRKREQHFIETVRPTLNLKRAYRTRSQANAAVRACQIKNNNMHKCSSCGFHTGIKTNLKSHLRTHANHVSV